MNITVSLTETVYMLQFFFYLTGKSLSYNQLKRYKTNVKMEKEKD